MHPLRRLHSALAPARALAVAASLAAIPACGPREPAFTIDHMQAADAELALTTLTDAMLGSFTSAEQAAADPDYRAVSLHMARLWPTRTDGVWLYVEQALETAPARPYRQRVYRLTAAADGSLRSDVYTLPGDPLAFAGAHADPAKIAALTPAALTLKDGCAITLHRQHEAFVGGTSGSGCASDLRGATYATSEVRITSTTLESWDRGFDAAGTQVWGAEKGPYVFRKIVPTP